MHSVQNASLGGVFSFGVWAQPMCDAGTVCMLVDTRGDNGHGALLGLMPPKAVLPLSNSAQYEPYFYPSPTSPGSNMGSGFNISAGKWSYIGVSVAALNDTGTLPSDVFALSSRNVCKTP